MLRVDFENVDHAEDDLLKYAVIVSRYQRKWITCKQKSRDTWEIPGGRRELGEAIMDTAKRELHEETGALDFELLPVCVYSVAEDSQEESKSYGLLCFADIKELGPLPDSEMERIQLLDAFPDELTYPLIQPLLFEKVRDFLSQK